MDVTTYEVKTAANSTNEAHSLPVREGYCPSCGQPSHFIYLGEQRWPEKVAAALGLSPVMLQWSCQICHTTLSEPQRGS
jgi:hypothetical protein